MTVKANWSQFLVAICLVSIAGAACADDRTLNLTLPAGNYYNAEAKSILLADNGVAAGKMQNTIVAPTPAAEFEPKPFTGKKIHEYLGLSTLALAGLTTLAAPGDGCGTQNCAQNSRPVNGAHAELAKATAVMAIATVVSGLIVHWDDFNFEDGWKDPDNQHVLLGVSGAALLAYAVNKSMNVSTGQVSHAGIAELGALSMLVAVKLTW
jgi:hypothetical protein